MRATGPAQGASYAGGDRRVPLRIRDRRSADHRSRHRHAATLAASLTRTRGRFLESFPRGLARREARAQVGCQLRKLAVVERVAEPGHVADGWRRRFAYPVE